MDTNRCVLQGRLTCDPVLRMTQTGKAVASFRIAVGLTRDRTLFISAQAWGKTAELIRQYLHKGSPAIFDGRLEPDEYTGRDGQPRCETILVAEGFSFCGPPPAQQPQPQAQGPYQQYPRQGTGQYPQPPMAGQYPQPPQAGQYPQPPPAPRGYVPLHPVDDADVPAPATPPATPPAASAANVDDTPF